MTRRQESNRTDKNRNKTKERQTDGQNIRQAKRQACNVSHACKQSEDMHSCCTAAKAASHFATRQVVMEKLARMPLQRTQALHADLLPLRQRSFASSICIRRETCGFWHSTFPMRDTVCRNLCAEIPHWMPPRLNLDSVLQHCASFWSTPDAVVALTLVAAIMQRKAMNPHKLRI